MDAKHHGNQIREFDGWLDRALHARNDAEPRMGLEDRVLARLASEPRRAAFLLWPSLAALAAALVIASALLVFHGRRSETSISNGLPSTTPLTSHSTAQAAASRSQRSSAIRRPSKIRRAPQLSVLANRRSEQREALPKLAQFPSPRTQTAQERMLMRLAAQRDSYETAALAVQPGLSELSVPELKVDRMAGTPPDNAPQR